MLIPTRSIGDLRLKNEDFITEHDRKKFNLKNLPYILNIPEFTFHEINPSDKYIVLASDGFWD